MQKLSQIRSIFENHIQAFRQQREPQNLYDPVSYIMGLGGKRIRPLLCAASYLLYKTELSPPVLNVCLALEVFHNFSLVHDDIMDEAYLRRGSTTVHQKWDVPTGILAGDVMLIDSYRLLQEGCAPQNLHQTLKVFNQTAIAVCEGQQLDMDFEKMRQVSWASYLQMIRGKTASLIGCSLEMGAIAAGQPEEICRELHQMGLNMGLAFQLKDDWLDAYGDHSAVGKQIGGDILRNKKSALYIKAMETATSDEQVLLEKIYTGEVSMEDSEKIEVVKGLFTKSGSADLVQASVAAYEKEIGQFLESLPGDSAGIGILHELLNELRGRAS